MLGLLRLPEVGGRNDDADAGDGVIDGDGPGPVELLLVEDVDVAGLKPGFGGVVVPHIVGHLGEQGDLLVVGAQVLRPRSPTVGEKGRLARAVEGDLCLDVERCAVVGLNGCALHRDAVVGDERFDRPSGNEVGDAGLRGGGEKHRVELAAAHVPGGLLVQLPVRRALHHRDPPVATALRSEDRDTVLDRVAGAGHLVAEPELADQGAALPGHGLSDVVPGELLPLHDDGPDTLLGQPKRRRGARRPAADDQDIRLHVSLQRAVAPICSGPRCDRALGGVHDSAIRSGTRPRAESRTTPRSACADRARASCTGRTSSGRGASPRSRCR